MKGCRGCLRRLSTRVFSHLGAGVDRGFSSRLDDDGRTGVLVEARIDRNALRSVQVAVGQRGRGIPEVVLWVKDRVDIRG